MALIRVQFQRAVIPNMQQLLIRYQDGARAAATTRLLIGSTLPYSSHWIEYGWRVDPRFGRVNITYRTPAATGFIRHGREQGAPLYRQYVHAALPFGAAAVRASMIAFARTVVSSMRARLDEFIYSGPPAPGHENPPRARTHNLYNDIAVRDAESGNVV